MLILLVGLSLNLLVLLALTHICFPLARRHTRKFFKLSYYNTETDSYRAGWNDIWMVTFWIVAFTGMRATVMDYILTPLGKKAGIKTPRDETRFAEQAWLITYYMVFWPIGMVSQQGGCSMRLFTNFETSISSFPPITGSTCEICGRIGHKERLVDLQNSTSSCNMLSGCSRLWLSTWRRGERTTGKCSLTML